MQKPKEEIVKLYEECLNAEVARMITEDNLGDNTFDILHFVELYLREQFRSCGVSHCTDDLKYEGCKLHYNANGNREGHLNLTIRPAFGVYKSHIITQEEEIEFHQLYDLLDWWQGKKELKDFHPDSYQCREKIAA